jgi:hypothetical protein
MIHLHFCSHLLNMHFSAVPRIYEAERTYAHHSSVRLNPNLECLRLMPCVARATPAPLWAVMTIGQTL